MTASKCKWMVGLSLAVAFSIAPFPILANHNETKITASDGTGNDSFGHSVSISGDYAVVGAIGDDDKGEFSGSAYVFKWNGGAWSQQAKLTAGDGAEDDRFGYSVSISGDCAVVGAIGDDDNGEYTGSAYVFKREGATWSQQTKLRRGGGAPSNYFGLSVSISASGDYVVVGSYGDDANGEDSGSANVFKREGEDWVAWSTPPPLTAGDAAAGDNFGHSVSISSDTVVVGAHGDDDNGSNSGSAYVFKRDGTAWSQQAKLIAGDGAEDDRFGISVSISGDYVVVGSHRDDDSGEESGSVYVFKRDGAAWSQQAKLTADDGAVGDFFGYSVSISGDNVVVGARGDDDNGSRSGSAYVFKRDGVAWSQQAKLIAGDGAADDFFGESVSVHGGDVVVGARGDDDNGSQSGSAYDFKRARIEGNLTTGVTGINGMPVVGATVSLQGTAYSTTSDVSGDYWFSETIEPGQYDLLITSPPFGPVIVPGIVVNEGELTNIPTQDLTVLSGDANGSGQQGLEDVIYLLEILKDVQ